MSSDSVYYGSEKSLLTFVLKASKKVCSQKKTNLLMLKAYK